MKPPALPVLSQEEVGPSLPMGVLTGSYRCSVPLIRPSKLSTVERGGVGKDLSEGWNLNFAVGCTHACPFCYVDSIHKRFGARYGPAVRNRWGDYLLIPANLREAIRNTPWKNWAGKEVMMSSTHDPYLPQLAPWARLILEAALPEGVRFCLQTRSYLVTKDFPLLARFASQVRVQVSLATLSQSLARMIEPRVPLPERRLQVLQSAKNNGLRIGVILAPILPPVAARPDVRKDLRDIMSRLSIIGPDHVYGESLHARGQNLRLIESALHEPIRLSTDFEEATEFLFKQELVRAGLKGTWWAEPRRASVEKP